MEAKHSYLLYTVASAIRFHKHFLSSTEPKSRHRVRVCTRKASVNSYWQLLTTYMLWLLQLLGKARNQLEETLEVKSNENNKSRVCVPAGPHLVCSLHHFQDGKPRSQITQELWLLKSYDSQHLKPRNQITQELWLLESYDSQHLKQSAVCSLWESVRQKDPTSVYSSDSF